MRVSLAGELAKLHERWHAGVPYTVPFVHGTMKLLVFTPRGADDQDPHSQDEVYVVVAGSGTLTVEGERFPFEPGDALFVGAGKEHQFVDFSDDLVTWAVVWGPEGGEPSTTPVLT